MVTAEDYPHLERELRRFAAGKGYYEVYEHGRAGAAALIAEFDRLRTELAAAEAKAAEYEGKCEGSWL